MSKRASRRARPRPPRGRCYSPLTEPIHCGGGTRHLVHLRVAAPSLCCVDELRMLRRGGERLQARVVAEVDAQASSVLHVSRWRPPKNAVCSKGTARAASISRAHRIKGPRVLSPVRNENADTARARAFVDRQRDGPAIAADGSGSRVHDIYSVRETDEPRSRESSSRGSIGLLVENDAGGIFYPPNRASR